MSKTIKVRDDLKQYFEIVETIENGKSAKLKCLHGDCNQNNPKLRIFTQRQGWNSHIDHLERQHQIDSSKFSRRKEKLPSIAQFVTRKKELPKYSNKNAYQKNNPKQSSFSNNLMDLVCVAGIPLNLVEHPVFLKFVRDLDPSIRLLSRRHLTRMINKEAHRMKKINCSKLQRVKGSTLHFSFDLWKSRSNKHVLGIKVHFIDDDWKLNSFTIAFFEFSERKKAENIRKAFLDEISTSYNIKPSQVGFIMTDNAKENVGAFEPAISNAVEEEIIDESEVLHVDAEDDDEINWENVEEESDDLIVEETLDQQCDEVYEDICDWTNAKLIRLGCITHALQLVIKECLGRNPRCAEIIAYTTRLTAFFSTSPYWHGKLLKLTNVGLVKIDQTRWNGILLALKWLLKENFVHHVNTILEEVKSTGGRRTDIPDLISPELESDLIFLSNLLTPFLDLTNDLQGEGVTSSRAILGIITCYKKIAAVQCGQDYMRALRGSLCLTLSERFGAKDQYNYSGRGAKKCLLKVFDNEAYILASMLDPRWKAAPFEIPLPEPYKLNQYVPSAEKAKTILVEAFEREKGLQNGGSSITSEPQQQSSKRAKTNFLASFLPDETSQPTHAVNEIEEYLKMSREHPESDPLEFWKKMDELKKFPILRQMAKKYLGFPSSSSSIERVFSISGSLNRNRRARLTTKTMENFLFYREFRGDELGI